MALRTLLASAKPLLGDCQQDGPCALHCFAIVALTTLVAVAILGFVQVTQCCPHRATCSFAFIISTAVLHRPVPLGTMEGVATFVNAFAIALACMSCLACALLARAL